MAKQNFSECASSLSLASGLDKQGLAVADNVDLFDILYEYEHYYEIKFQRSPKLVRQSGGGACSGGKKSAAHKGNKLRQSLPKLDNNAKASKETSISESTADLITTKQLNLHARELDPQPVSTQGLVSHELHGETADSGAILLKPLALGSYAGSAKLSEYEELVQIIKRDMFVEDPQVKWSDIAGLETPKRLIKEAVIFPMKYPELFTGILQPWKGVLLYGMPGCGKTMLAKAVATECKTTFFNISASSLVSKWRGESEKLVRVLFDMARHHAPSTIFLDELDAIMGSRAAEGEHEGSRRMKTEILIQMDGLSKSNDGIFVLAASNLPWELDNAMIRRLEKRIHIDLPDTVAVQAMLENWLPLDLKDGFGNEMVDSTFEYHELARELSGYSGSDILTICKEAAMIPLRDIFNKLEQLDNIGNDDDIDPTNHDNMEIVRKRITANLVRNAMKTVKHSCDQTLRKQYIDWSTDFGAI